MLAFRTELKWLNTKFSDQYSALSVQIKVRNIKFV
jgi:hypothetical protein